MFGDEFEDGFRTKQRRITWKYENVPVVGVFMQAGQTNECGLAGASLHWLLYEGDWRCSLFAPHRLSHAFGFVADNNHYASGLAQLQGIKHVGDHRLAAQPM
jgi:hypothetical protein